MSCLDTAGDCEQCQDSHLLCRYTEKVVVYMLTLLATKLRKISQAVLAKQR